MSLNDMDPDKEYPDPHPEEEAWELAKKWVPKGANIDEYRKEHLINYHAGCEECGDIKTHNRLLDLRKGMERLKKEVGEALIDVRVAKMSGICRNCSTLRDINGKCGCNDN